NLKELLGGHPTLGLTVLGLVLLTCGGVPGVLAVLWRRRPYRSAKLFAPTAVAIASALFVALWLVAPAESLDDVVGTPVLGVGRTLERWLRFVGLLIGPLAGVTLGARVGLGGFLTWPTWAGAAVTVAVMLSSYVVVVPLAD